MSENYKEKPSKQKTLAVVKFIQIYRIFKNEQEHTMVFKIPKE